MEDRMEVIVFLVLLTTAASIAVRREEFAEAVAYLRNYGYLHIPLDTKDQRHSTEEIIEALRIFQKATDIPVSGKLNKATLVMMNKPRCGIEDSFSSKTLRYHAMGHWRKKTLTYRIYSYTPDLGVAATHQAIQAAFRLWSEVSPLRFQEVAGARADIKISFHRKEKTCPVPFDGRGRVLAHADAPQSGIVHFDADELWTEGKNQGSNLRIVAAHEIGHALGLGHSQHRSALMGPVYNGYRANFQLHPDDIKGIQALYGTPQKTPPVSRNPNQGAGLPPDPCRAAMDAVMSGPADKTYVFSGHYVWTMSDSGHTAPVLISALWKDLPGNLNAAVHSQLTGKSYFLKGDRLWRYTGSRLDRGFPGRLTSVPADIDSAFYSKKNRRLIFIKGAAFWQWDETGRTDFGSRGKPLGQLFPGSPLSPDASMTGPDGHTYVFKGGQYWRVHEDRKDKAPSPRSVRSHWMQCDD